ncbi:hypothetical protein BDZ94DRAFT_698456 [Collybia nuda]|uniref:Uncharacterized protein n=1 Tax=Collybia nuda TaxID=64659 RepID=A0A9P6CJG1_9AGAR|nr:hypothetical protein BDZ94DRAFT_698456 [Collybia nuda]
MDQLSSISAQGSKTSRTMSTLNNGIETLKIAKDLIPLELGKGVLSAFEGILTLVRAAAAYLVHKTIIDVGATTINSTIYFGISCRGE